MIILVFKSQNKKLQLFVREKKRKHELMKAEAKQMGDKTLTLDYNDS